MLGLETALSLCEFFTYIDFQAHRARYYDANTGRFLQKDPVPGKLDISSTVINAYIYVINSPLMHTDSTGRFLDWIWKGLIAVGAVVLGAIVGPIVAAVAGFTGVAGIFVSAIVVRVPLFSGRV